MEKWKKFLVPSSLLERGENLSDAEVRVLLSLFFHRNLQSNCSYPGYKLIQEETGKSHSMIRKVISSLERKGKIKTEKKRSKNGWHNVYEFVCEQWVQDLEEAEYEGKNAVEDEKSEKPKVRTKNREIPEGEKRPGKDYPPFEPWEVIEFKKTLRATLERAGNHRNIEDCFSLLYPDFLKVLEGLRKVGKPVGNRYRYFLTFLEKDDVITRIEGLKEKRTITNLDEF